MERYKNIHRLAQAGLLLQEVKEDLEKVHGESKALDTREQLGDDIDYLKGIMDAIGSIMKRYL